MKKLEIRPKITEILSHTQQAEATSQLTNDILELSGELNAQPGTIAWDLVCFRAKQQLMDTYKVDPLVIGYWDDFWSRTTKTIRHSPSHLYDPPRVYNLLLHSDSVFEELKQSYLMLQKSKGASLPDDFLDVFFRIRNSVSPQISHGEMEIFRAAIDEQTLSPSKLSEVVDTSKGYVSRIVGSLVERGLLTEAVRFSYRALKLKVMALLIEMDNLDAALPQGFTSDNPWLHSVTDCKFGNRFIMAYFIVPLTWRSRRELSSWQRRLLTIPRVTDVHILERIEHQCWRNYNYEWFDGSEWHLPTGTYAPFIKSRMTEGVEVLPTQATPPELDNFVLQTFDVEILGTLWESGRLSVRELREQLSKDYNAVRKRYSELVDRNILRVRIHPTSLFAAGNMTLVSHLDESMHTRLTHALTCLPEVYAERTRDGYSIHTVRIPEGHEDTVADTLNTILKGKERWLMQHTDRTFANWSFPMDRWMPQHREWRVEESDFGVEFNAD